MKHRRTQQAADPLAEWQGLWDHCEERASLLARTPEASPLAFHPAAVAPRRTNHTAPVWLAGVCLVVLAVLALSGRLSAADRLLGAAAWLLAAITAASGIHCLTLQRWPLRRNAHALQRVAAVVVVAAVCATAVACSQPTQRNYLLSDMTLPEASHNVELALHLSA